MASNESMQVSSENDMSKDQLQKRLERFKRRMNKRKEQSHSGRTTPTSSVGGPPSEYGRALSSASVPAFRHHYVPANQASLVNNNSQRKDAEQTMASRAQLIKSLLQENEKLKATLDQWTPVVAAYRTCHALVQDLNSRVEEKDAKLDKLAQDAKDQDKKINELKLKIVENERRTEMKDAALNQLKSKVIELKAQLEKAHLAEADLQRQLGDRSRVLDQLQRGGTQTQPLQSQQQAAMAMMTMQLQKEMAGCMTQLREREQEVETLTSERDNLMDACTQLQEALQSATTMTMGPISMEMSFKPPPSALISQETQTEDFEKDINLDHTEGVLADSTSTDNIIQTDPFTLPNCSSIEVQFSSVDLEPLVIDLPEDYIPAEFPRSLERSYFPDLADGYSQCNIAEFVVVRDNATQSDEPSVEETTEKPVLVDSSVQPDNDFIGNDTIDSVTQTEYAGASTDELGETIGSFVDCETQTAITESTEAFIDINCDLQHVVSVGVDTQNQTDGVEFAEAYTDMTCGIVSAGIDSQTQTIIVESVEASTDTVGGSHMETFTQTELLEETRMESVTQTNIVETTEKGVDPDILEFCAGESQTDTFVTSETGTDAGHSMFLMSHSFAQSDVPSRNHTPCQTDSYQAEIVESHAQTLQNVVLSTGSDPILFSQNAETQVESAPISSPTFSEKENNGAPEKCNFGCQVVLTEVALPLEDRVGSPHESVMSLMSDCFSTTNWNATASSSGLTATVKTPAGVLCPTEMDALRAAVRLLSREKRDLQSRLAALSRVGHEPMRTVTPLTTECTISTPSPFMPVSSPPPVSTPDTGVHSSLSAIQRKITELREQLAAASHQQHSSNS